MLSLLTFSNAMLFLHANVVRVKEGRQNAYCQRENPLNGTKRKIPGSIYKKVHIFAQHAHIGLESFRNQA